MIIYTVQIRHTEDPTTPAALTGLNRLDPDAITEFDHFENDGQVEVHTIQTSADIDRYLDLTASVIVYDKRYTVQLDHEQIIAAIEAGDNCNGSRVLAVAPDGSASKVCFLQTTRQWDPYPDGWELIGIPALDPDGSGRASEDAQDMLRSVLSPEAFQAAEDRQQTGDIGWIDLAEELAPEDWSYNRRESAEWLADAFLAACNGDGLDLNRPHPWGEAGYTNDGDWEPRIIQPPATFEWEAKETA